MVFDRQNLRIGKHDGKRLYEFKNIELNIQRSFYDRPNDKHDYEFNYMKSSKVVPILELDLAPKVQSNDVHRYQKTRSH